MIMVSKEGLMKMHNILLQVLLSLIMDPLLEIMEIKGITIFYFLIIQPFEVKFKITLQLLAIEDSIYHMTAK